MALSRIISRRSVTSLSRVCLYPHVGFASASTGLNPCSAPLPSGWIRSPVFSQHCSSRLVHTSQQEADVKHSSAASFGESDTHFKLDDFLSRFVWKMRKEMKRAYPECDKATVDGMLVVIVNMFVGGPATVEGGEISEDLWKTVQEVREAVIQDMAKEKKKVILKRFLQSEKVKEKYRFAGEIGIRGDMLRELRFKWAREEMEKSMFYERLERNVKEYEEVEEDEESEDEEVMENEEFEDEEVMENEESEDAEIVEDEDTEEGAYEEADLETLSLPKRHGQMNYKIYGLNLSDPKWTEVADKIHESGKVLWPQEAKPITGKCKLVTKEILSLKEEDDPTSLLGQWMELQQPSRIEWIALLDRLKEQNPRQYLKIAEHLLGEDSFQANIHDYSRLVDNYSKSDRLEDAERVLNKMHENGIEQDAITSTIIIEMFSKAGNIEKAKEAFENLRTSGFQPGIKVYSSLIMAFVNADEPSRGESLMRDMETRNMKPTYEIYMALLRSYAKHGDAKGAQRISMTMQFAGFQQSLESFTLMVEACVEANDSVQAKINFDQLINSRHKPDDRCVAAIISGYEQNNELDAALNLLMDLEKDGFVPGVATYTNMVDWLAKMELIAEAEQIIDKIAELREPPPIKLHISMCDMYSKAGVEKKVSQAVGVLESKSDELGQKELERIIEALAAGGYTQESQKFQSLMEARGYTPSEKLRMNLMASKAFKKGNASTISRFARKN